MRQLALGAVGLALLLTGCQAASPACGPATCAGCCDAKGTCLPGTSLPSCGTAGQSCQACGGNQACQLGFCTGGTTCTPTTCQASQKNCGALLDGCGGTLNCGTCEVSSESCGGGGVPNVCGTGTCTPNTCAGLGKNCGQLSDGCSSVLNCGTCTTAGDTCGGGGTPNVCGHGACFAATCSSLGKNCGTVSDGCGGQLDCGTCTTAGDSCGGGGIHNVCGHGACTPQTCQQLGASCGSIDDGCGNTLTCGSCTGFLTCGGGGTPNACGATCPTNCPNGYSCSTDAGVCAGGNPTSLVFNIPVPAQFGVSGDVTLNGANPVATYCYSTTGVSLKFVDSADSRFNTTLAATCNTTGAPFAFTGQLYPGTYQVTASNGSPYNTDNLPNWDTVVATALTVSSTQSGVVFDIPVPPQYTVSGEVTLNGANPVATYCYSTTGVSLKFANSADSRFNTTLSATCNTTGAPFTFSGPLYPGTYQVTASNGSPYNTDNLPNWDTVVATAFTVGSAQSGVVFDIPVPPQYAVSGDVTLNGANPVASYCYSTTGVSLKFVDSSDSRLNTTLSATCNTTGAPFTFSGQLYPGTYQVTASNGSPYNTDNLPNWDTVVATALTVSGTQSGVVFDIPVPPQYTVSGDVTLNGANPVATYCYSTTGVSLKFVDSADSRFNTTLNATCNTTGAPFTFSGQLYPGTYQVTASNGSPYNTDNLPNWDTVVSTAFTVGSAQSGVVFDIPVPPQYTVSGDVTLNGANPIASYCYSTTGVSLKFVDSADSRFNTTLDATCNTTGAPFSFTGQLYPGTYQVTASNGSPYNTDNLPNWDTVVATALTVSGTQSGVIFDIPVPAQISVSGDVTLNGANPVATYCYSTTGVSLDFTCLSDARFSTTLSATCNTTGAPWTFAGELYPGVYQVTASNGSPYNTDNLPNWSTVVVDRLQVP